MKKITMLSFVIAWMMLGMAIPMIHAQCPNTLATLNGKYVFFGVGDVYSILGLFDTQISQAGYVTLNGTGNAGNSIVSNFKNGVVTTTSFSSGIYVLNSDCSYKLTLNGSPQQIYILRIGFNGETPTQRLLFDDDDPATDMSIEGFLSTDPSGGCTQSSLSGIHNLLITGFNANNQKTSGVVEITVAADDTITGEGMVSIEGNQTNETITGTTIVNTDCSVDVTSSINGGASVKEKTYLIFTPDSNGIPQLTRWFWPDGSH